MVQSAAELELAFQRLQREIVALRSQENISQQVDKIRIVNEKLMNIERAFIHPEGLPGRPYLRYFHVDLKPPSIKAHCKNTSVTYTP